MTDKQERQKTVTITIERSLWKTLCRIKLRENFKGMSEVLNYLLRRKKE